MLPNIIICTLIMWGLTAIAVVPLANKWFADAKAANPAFAVITDSEIVSNEINSELNKLYNTKFIQADMLVMGIAGVLAGLLGFPLIGFAWKAKAWPGLLVLIATSFLSYYITGQNKMI